MVSEVDFQSFPQVISLWELNYLCFPLPDESLHEISSHLAN